MADQKQPKYTIIATCYYEDATIAQFHERLSRTMEADGRDYEIVLVNDGSTDRTFECLRAIIEKDPKVHTVADLFSNSGQIYAMAAALEFARGENIVFIDSDLQLEPEQLPELLDKFEEGYDIVSGARMERNDPLGRRVGSVVANWVMRYVARKPLKDFGCTFKVYNGRLVRAFRFGPRQPWSTAYVFRQAQRVAEIPIRQHPRPHGKSGWRLSALSLFLMDHVVGLFRQAFQIIFLVCFLFSLLVGARIALAWVLPFQVLPQVTNGMILNALFYSLMVTVAVLCLIGEYAIRTFFTQRGFPGYVVRQVLRRSDEGDIVHE